MRAPCLASVLKRGILPLKIVIMDIKNGQGGEGLFLAHWLSYEKLNLCMLCGNVVLQIHILHVYRDVENCNTVVLSILWCGT